MVIVLNGMIIAAINGNKLPVTANDNPATLYSKESTKLILIVFMEFLHNFKK